MSGTELLGLLIILAIAAFAIYALRRGRKVKPDDYRATNWLGRRPGVEDDLPPDR